MGRCIASDAVQELQTTVSHCSMKRRPAITHSQTHFVCLDYDIFNDVNRRFFSPVLQYLFARHRALSHYLQEYVRNEQQFSECGRYACGRDAVM